MPKIIPQKDFSLLTAASDRVFRSYFVHCAAPDADSLFNYLNALHSFNDKLPKECRLFGSREFVGLKALRNIFHHHEELLADVKIVPAKNIPMAVELMHVCLVAAELIERAALLPRERQPEVVLTVFNRYGKFCDIEPAIFNATVDVFEVSTKLALRPASPAYQEFEASYQYENEQGISHRVKGSILARAGDANEIFERLTSSPAGVA